ncbi:MAG: hypothetical protein HRU38_26305 [Saccharospirillaceae bacterium]|nr:hypothetical protein [Saccharospirillaceae bacterium]
MWKESDMSNAFSRKITRDMPKMPALMRKLFYISEWTKTASMYLAFILLFVGFGLIFTVLGESYFLGGNTPIFENQLTNYLYYIVGLLAFDLALPFILGFTTRNWYYNTRADFN